MKIFLNGASTEARDSLTIAELVEHHGFHPNTVLVEHNGLALHRREWTERKIAEADRIEFVRVVAGG